MAEKLLGTFSRRCELQKPPRVVALVSEKKPSVLEGWSWKVNAQKNAPLFYAHRNYQKSTEVFRLALKAMLSKSVHTQTAEYFLWYLRQKKMWLVNIQITY